MTAAIAVVLSVALLAGATLKGLQMVLAFRAREVVHAPIADLERRIQEMESKLLARAMGGRG